MVPQPAKHSKLSPLSEQAVRYQETRKAHATEITEDYVELIADLIAVSGEARVVDLAKSLGVTHVTVVRTIARLKSAGLVETKPYRSIFLTATGDKLAARIRRRHQIVEDFLRSLGISDQAAKADAEGVEHHISDETLEAFEKHLKRLKPKHGQRRGKNR